MLKSFESSPRDFKSITLQKIMTPPHKPNTDEYYPLHPDNDDFNYELTLDNSLKLIAIYLRVKSKIPVILMGETGCGKTSLIKYFALLNLNKNNKHNLIHVKMHGGTTSEYIEKKLIEAEKLSIINFNLQASNPDSNPESNQNPIQTTSNTKRHTRSSTTSTKSCINSNPMPSNPSTKSLPITAILFLDEANTSTAIGLIKEIICDNSCNGRAITLEYGLVIIAAINPYRKHSIKMINKLEAAGLGFYLHKTETHEKFGHIPMRQLVYRVQPLPQSLMPYVWEIGQLNYETEKKYVIQMLFIAFKETLKTDLKKVNGNQEGSDKNDKKKDSTDLSIENQLEYCCKLIIDSQNFMRSKQDECSFKSIRDVERVIL
jgi:hypothetical protein